MPYRRRHLMIKLGCRFTRFAGGEDVVARQADHQLQASEHFVRVPSVSSYAGFVPQRLGPFRPATNRVRKTSPEAQEREARTVRPMSATAGRSGAVLSPCYAVRKSPGETVRPSLAGSWRAVFSGKAEAVSSAGPG